MNGRFAVVAILFLSFLLISSPVMAGEWVPAGTDHPGFRIMDVALSGDGASGALAGDAGVILLKADGTEQWRIPDGRYRSVALSGDGDILAAGGDGILVMHRNNTVIATMPSRNYVNDITVTADGSRIAAAVDDETLRIYTTTGTLLQCADTGDDLVSVAYSPDGTYITGGTDTGSVILFSGDGEERWTYGLSRQPVSSVAMADSARTIAAVSEDGKVALFSRAGGLLWSGSAPHAGGVAVSADGDTAAVADMQGIRIIERDGTDAGMIPSIDASVSAAMDNDGTLIVVTDGVRISGFVQDAVGPDGDPAPVETVMPVSEGSPAPTAEETTVPAGQIPVSTQSPSPLLTAIGGLFLAGYILRGRISRDTF